MTQVLDFFSSNYIWFVVGIIVIFLAIIGYHADKTNFGQGKPKETKQNENTQNLDNIRLDDIVNKDNKVLENSNNTNQLNNIQQNSAVTNVNSNIVRYPSSVINSPNVVNNLGNNQVNNFQFINSSLTAQQINELETLTEGNKNLVEENMSKQVSNKLLSEEEVNKFNIEFDSLLPKKEIIDSDLLSDIDDLELGKTQKINLSDVPDLDNIELPKIGNFKEEQDIWKF